MAKARKVNPKPPRNRSNTKKRLKIIKANQEMIKEFMSKL